MTYQPQLSEWQKCPICGGSGIVSGGYYEHAGDTPSWASDHAAETCRQCQGRGMIIRPALPLSVGNEAGK